MSAALAQPDIKLADNLTLAGTVPKALEVKPKEIPKFPEPGPKELPPPPPSPYELLKQRLIDRLKPLGTYDASTYAYHQCAWYVASRISVPPFLGDADQWDNLGTSDTPLIGAIAQTDAGYWGHLAIVEAVDGDMVEVSEYNYIPYSYDVRWTSRWEFSYIY